MADKSSTGKELAKNTAIISVGKICTQVVTFTNIYRDTFN